MKLSIEIPYPPVTGNQMWRKGRGVNYLNPKTTQYYRMINFIVKTKKKAVNLADKLSVTVAIHPPDNRRRDLTNAWKVIEDALTKAGVWLDDYQIDVLKLCRMPVFKGGKIQIEIETI